MAKGKMSPEEILSAVKQLIEEAKNSGDKLNGTAIARRVGCGRTTLYTNQEVRELLIQEKIIDDTPSDKTTQEKPKKNDHTILERRLQKSEERANRLELLLAESKESIKQFEEENRRLRLEKRLLMEGKSII
ncbi:hypothetical protein [Neobacillus sp. NPDC093127]|uniref:hypothetical protein n=1 Tax=Neobacillus sp. NPDC093127 TaxID=3364296 RepID=UPI00380BA36D